MADKPTIVVGGGLAGIAAALRLADMGRRVVLVEKRPRLGGEAFSFTRGELTIDNGQHVFLRCCTAYQWFLERIGARHQVVLQDRLDIPILSPDGRRARLRRTRGVPAPAHLTAALATYGVLGPADRARAVRGALALRMLNPSNRALDDRTLGEYLRAHGQNDATIAALWGIVATATLNLDPDSASLALAAKVFRTGMLDSAPAADVGYAAVPLGRLHDDGAAKALADAGVEVLADHAVREVVPGSPVQVEGPRGTHELPADSVIMAVPHHAIEGVLASVADSPAGRATALDSSPIVNVHVVYDRPVTDLPFAAAVNSPVQWFFDRTDSSGLSGTRPGAQYLAVTVSAASGLIDEPSKQLLARFVPELARLLPQARRAEVIDAFVTRERRATFRQAAGTWRLRPSTDEGPAGVWLAGAWTDTGWPDTMEGAVRSGVAAAEAAAGLPHQERTEFGA
jgi:squalene-associated FAD-dependent desaturase